MNDESKQYLYQAVATLVIVGIIFWFKPFTPKFSFTPSEGQNNVGWITLVTLIVSLAYALRKREFLQAPGKLIYWKIFHIATGYLFIIFLLLHANGHLGGGLQLFQNIAAGVIVISGLFGVIKQGYVPQVMTDTLLDPVYKSELQNSVDKLMDEIDKVLRERSDEFKEIYQRHVLPFTVITLPTAEQQKTMLQRCFGPDDIDPNAAIKDVKHLDDQEVALFFEIAEKAMDVVEIRRGQSYQRQMNRWLTWHIGSSFLLVIFVFFHILASSYF